MGRISVSGQINISGSLGIKGPEAVPLIDIITNLGLEGNLVYCLDAADPNSYSESVGGQTWADVSGNGNDFLLGETSSVASDDPTFNTGGWWDFVQGEYFKQSSASKLAAVDDCHQNNALCTFFARIYVKPGGAIFNNNIDGTNSNNVGVLWRVIGAGTIRFESFRALNSNALQATSTDNVTTDAWHNIATSIDEGAGAGGGFHWADNAFLQTSASDTFNATYTSPSAGAAIDVPNIGMTSNVVTNQGLVTGSKLAAFALWSGVALTKANLDAIGSQIDARIET